MHGQIHVIAAAVMTDLQHLQLGLHPTHQQQGEQEHPVRSPPQEQTHPSSGLALLPTTNQVSYFANQLDWVYTDTPDTLPTGQTSHEK